MLLLFHLLPPARCFLPLAFFEPDHLENNGRISGIDATTMATAVSSPVKRITNTQSRT